jgi:hypothetical protein
MVNVIYETANLIRGQVTARITPKSWWANMKNGWVWDLDDFEVNQIGHPYQGNNYFNTGRANGLSFAGWCGVAVSAAAPSFRRDQPALGQRLHQHRSVAPRSAEMFHRAAWLVRDTRATGRGRLWREIGATALDPVTGYNPLGRDAKRITEEACRHGTSRSCKALHRQGPPSEVQETRAFDAAGQPFLELNMLYGDPRVGRSRTPYDAFSVRFRLGGGAAFSEARVRGRLLGQPLGGGKTQFTVMQSYDFQSNDAYATGAQSVEAAVGVTHALSSRNDLWFLGWGGLTVLGAIDSLPLGITERPEKPEPGPGGGQGVSEGPRFYDYGPGSTFGATALFSRDRHIFAVLLYEGRHLYSLDGVRANHFMQRSRVDLLLPLRGPIGLGASAEYFFRQTFYRTRIVQPAVSLIQFRAYLTWRIE